MTFMGPYQKEYSQRKSYCINKKDICGISTLELCADDQRVGGGVWSSYDRRRRRAEQFSSAAAAWPSWSAAAVSAIS